MRFLLVLPALVIAGSACLGPLHEAGEIGLRRYLQYRVHATSFVGFDNYERSFSAPRFWSSLIVTGMCLLMVVTAIDVLGLSISELSNRDKAGPRGAVRSSLSVMCLLMPIINFSSTRKATPEIGQRVRVPTAGTYYESDLLAYDVSICAALSWVRVEAR